MGVDGIVLEVAGKSAEDELVEDTAIIDCSVEQDFVVSVKSQKRRIIGSGPRTPSSLGFLVYSQWCKIYPL